MALVLPDPGRSHAVLVGVHEYRQLDPLPGVAGGVGRLADLLCDPAVWGLPRRNVTVVVDHPSADDILTAVRDAGQTATDTLVVYFAGHGLRKRGIRRLYLALDNADADQEQLEIGTLPYPELRGVVRQAGGRARHRITLLDCCYSGLAIPMGASADVLERSDLERLLGTPDAEEESSSDDDGDVGSCMMTSSSGTQRSFTPPRGYPYFTGALIEVLEKGISEAGPTLNIYRVWEEAERLLQERRLPRPQHFGHNAASEEPWVRNRAYVAQRAAPPLSNFPAEPVQPLRAAPTSDTHSDHPPFGTVQGGYDIGTFKKQLDVVKARVADPRQGWQVQPPYFRSVSSKRYGYDNRQVDAYIEEHRTEPKEFVDALRLLLARQGITVLPDGGSEGLKIAWVKKKCGVSGRERLIGHLESRSAKVGAVAFTDTHLCLHSATLMRVPYPELQNLSLTSSSELVRWSSYTDQGGDSGEDLVISTSVAFGHRSLEFREYAPEPVHKALRVFLSAAADLRRSHPEWFCNSG
ncbi:caspase domain-containing protein [Streptomyces sp. NPDC088560]|uniref:caspase family protein n=1 Tax=Streptomyces sp. NPDC088560 TaxID=3365868 RepID=UPI00381ACC55